MELVCACSVASTHKDKKKIEKNIGKNIRKLRELKNYSQQSLANEIGISQKQYSRIESGNVSPTYDTLLDICKSLQISFNQLLGFDENIIFNNHSDHQQGGEYIAYYAADINQIKLLYEQLLKEKDERILMLQQMLSDTNL